MSESSIFDRLRHESHDMRSVLDVGAGNGMYLHFLEMDRKEAIEAHRPYAEQIKANALYIGRAQEHLEAIPDRHVDLVMALDFIEHLDKPEAIKVLREMKRVANKRVVIFTPCGFHKQDQGEPEAGRFTEEEWKWQTHRSGWEPEEFRELGFNTEVYDFDYGKGADHERAIWATWNR